ncbi:MAG: CRISPR-associated endonuclease Cas2 [Gaiellales bacterium]|nr:MAG: CRISPR-associated endonuclease Cas2 [Gaiellales bacterium]
MSTYVLYDIPDDTIRTKIAEVCKDYGLERIQFSAFCGSLTRNKREELFLRLGEVLGEQPGKILLQPVCEKDIRDGLRVEHEDTDAEPAQVDATGQRPEAV